MPRSIAPRPAVSGATVEVQTSVPVELIAAIMGVAKQEENRPEWLDELAATVGEHTIARIVEFCRPLRHGVDLVEFTADAPANDDAQSFLDFIAGLSDHEIAFYLLGRMYPVEQLPRDLSERSIRALLAETGTDDSAYHDGAGFEWANDVPAARNTIVELLEILWDGYVNPHMQEIRERWALKTAEINDYINRNGGRALWRLVADSETLPMQIPEGQPYTRILFVPSCLTSFGHNYMFGYGKIIVVVNCSKSFEDVEQTRIAADEMIAVLKAISDKNRLRLLRFITKRECSVNGKQLAELLKLSPSVVSRHLAQLRSAGLINEHTEDNRNITYSLIPEPLDRLSASVLEYLHQPLHG